MRSQGRPHPDMAGNEEQVLAAARAYAERQKGPVLDAWVAPGPVPIDDGGTKWVVFVECSGGAVVVGVRVGPDGRTEAGPLTYRLI